MSSMKLCISEATTMAATFAEDVAGFADAGCSAMEVWLTKLETHLEKHSPADARKMLEDRQMKLAAASYQGGLLLSQGRNARPISTTSGVASIFASISGSLRCWLPRTSTDLWTSRLSSGR